MTTYLALLRGINVGWNKKVEMSRLKACFEEMGFQNVSTYINSGNVIFESEKHDFSNVEKTLKATFWFEIPVVFRTRESVIELAGRIPSKWQNNEEQKTDILFLWETYDNAESLKLIKTNPEVDHLLYIDGAIAWNIPRAKYNKSKMHDFIGTPLYKNMTARNVNTVRKLANLLWK